MTHQEQLLKSLYIMASMVEARDPYTGGHLWRVAQYSKLLARNAGWGVADVARVKLGGYLHDLGKIGVPDAILNKAGRLDEDEYAIIKTHPEVGTRLISGHPLAKLVQHSIHSHHETIDGGGYPQGLRGDDIPVDARVVGICDAYDAMTSTRPYRRGMPAEKALSIISDNLGKQFDPQWGARFVALGRAGALDHILGHSDWGIPLQDCPMCGPTIVVRRDQQSGESVYCRACGSHAHMDKDHGKISLKFSGKKGSAEELQPMPDLPQIDELARKSAAALGDSLR